jgi:hypothetical protein
MCLLIVCMGVVASVDALTRALFGTIEGSVGWIPFLGRVVQAPIHRIEQKVSNYMGGLETHIDVSMGGYFHALADALGRLASGEAEAGWVFYWLAKAHSALRATVHALPSLPTVHSITHTVVKQVRVVVTKVDHVGKIAAHAAPASLIRDVRAIAGTLDDVVTWDIPRLWKRSRAIEKSLDRLWHRIRAEKKVLVGTAFAGAVAVALGRMGLGWLRCSSLKRVGKQLGCGGFGLLEELFAASLVSFAALDICDFAAAAESVAESFVPALLALVDVEDALIGCHGATAAPRLTLPALHLPPENLGLQLAA